MSARPRTAAKRERRAGHALVLEEHAAMIFEHEDRALEAWNERADCKCYDCAGLEFPDDYVPPPPHLATLAEKLGKGQR